ncbi:MAG: type II secretion system GspH family protein [Thermodesulfovibrionales bacterium]|nr:type II secretion system GspH family protein [Thermodesulfovibrionales bacterium]
MKILFNKIPLNPPLKKGDSKYSTIWQRGVRGDFKKFPLFHSIFRAKSRNGFTLLEVIVVMGIISLMVGILVPMVYRLWESNEIDITKERMRDLKIAMVGDPKLIQNGVRTNFGFVGDNGQLPGTISNALLPYMPSGYNPNNCYQDAWGNKFEYTVTPDPPGRNVSATLKSKGPDGILGNDDDIDDITDPELQMNESEVTPTNIIQGNLSFVFYNSGTQAWTPPAYSAKIELSYNLSGIPLPFCCVPLPPIGVIPKDSPGNVIQKSVNFNSLNCSLTNKLPVGKVLFQAGLYSDASCATIVVAQSPQVAVFVNDGINAVTVNLSTINYTCNWNGILCQ